MIKKIVVGAGGGHGKSVADSALLQSEYQMGGYIDDVYPAVADVWSPVLRKVTAQA